MEAKEFAKGLQGGGSLVEEIDQALRVAYGCSADLRYQRMRYAAALHRYMDAFPDAKRVSLARAPGRVNLIGEHTDYNGLPVLPMAIDRDVVVLFSPRKDRRVNLVNTSYWFPPRNFEISKRIRPYGIGNWGNYAKAAAQVLQEASPHHLRGMDACIMGDVPAGSGLSSSSALVVALGVALASVNELSISPVEMAGLLAKGEMYVGTEGGGMDQAASLLAECGKAVRIEFSPLEAFPIELPQDCSFVLCNSLVTAEKTAAARDGYNRRVIECRLGAAMLMKVLGGGKFSPRNLTIYSSLRHLSKDEQNDLIGQIPPESVTLRDVAKFVGVSARALSEAALRMNTGEIFKEPKGGFCIQSRVKHVLTEGRRVELAAEALASGDIGRFGELMDESHVSCACDYEISTPELDTLVGICREEGAVGARLTGAGFGGCAVALVRDRDVPDFISGIISRYYHEYLPNERSESPMSIMALEDAIFPCKPCGGAGTIL